MGWFAALGQRRGAMPKPGNKIHIPPPQKQAVDPLLKVKPTPEMPKPGAQAGKPKTSKKSKKGGK
jgi:hypothetical protein